MKILSVMGKYYGGSNKAIEPMYLEFSDPLRDLGHVVEHFDHKATTRQHGILVCGERFVDFVRTGKFDLVFYQTAGKDHMPREAIREATRYAPVAAWNSDDDWQWESYSRDLAPFFTFMVTTYRHIYDANKHAFPNLYLSQWGCYDRYAHYATAKDIPFSFLGRIYGSRYHDCRFLRAQAGLQIFGANSRLVALGIPLFRGCSRLPWLTGVPIADYAEANNIWNRSRISYTPLEASSDPSMLQIKGRVFQMGLSGTLMLCNAHPALAEYYEPEKEFVTYSSIEECADKARHYLTHETERALIARAYYKRTLTEHLWQHRFQRLLTDMGFPAPGRVEDTCPCQ